MSSGAALFLIALTFLAACTSSGYNRPYITTDTFEEQVLSETGEAPL